MFRGFTAALVVLALSALVGAACGGGDGTEVRAPDPDRPTGRATSTATPTRSAERPAAESPPAVPTCVAATDSQLLRVVDKASALPSDYVPDNLVAIPERLLVPVGPRSAQLREDAFGALVALLDKASDAGYELRVRSAFRSFAEQERTFRFWADLLGEEQAARESARAGHSEHQLGTTVDLASESVGWELIPELGDTPEGQWLEDHASEFGFALSYPRDAEEITGYVYEPWHYRYIGTACAEEWAQSEETLVEFLRALGGSTP